MNTTTEDINEIINKEFDLYLRTIKEETINEITKIRSSFPATISTLTAFGLDQESIAQIIQHGMSQKRNRMDPFWGNNLVSNRMKNQQHRK